MERFDRFYFNELNREEIKKGVAYLNKSLTFKIDEFKCSVVGNKVYFFEIKILILRITLVP